ncbi:MAG TPA: type I DNA topoisomerase [Verrucomicrobiae bacterium]|jgi:DNA topoisomerase-1|nr:type I DNA topoisomerase [Verrucomicrobiae bacterium]
MAGKTKAEPKKTSRGAKNLVIVESPAKAKTINKFLGKNFQVEASMGHVRDLPKSKMGIDVQNDFTPHYVIVAKSRKIVSHLKKQAKGKENIYLAPDPDREGEAISWHLAHILKEADGEVAIRRVVFNEITKEAVQKAFEKTREIEMNLVNSQQARRILDRVVGYELSPLLWHKVGRGLSAGRVQSVALRLIVEREREIRKFVPQEYWSLEAKLSPEDPKRSDKAFIAKLEKIGDEKADLKNKEQTKKIRDEILTLPFKVDKLEKKERKRLPQAPYTTSKLQQEAFNRLGFPAAKTMSIAQKLYEGIEIGDEGSVGLITYMRTDSVNIAVSAQAEASAFIKEKYGDNYLPEKPPVYKSKKGAQEAHEAIRPSSIRRDPEDIKSFLSDDEYRLYRLIWRKFVSSQMMPAIDEHVVLWTVAGEKYYFKTTGRRNLFPGFSAVFEDVKKPEEDKKEGDEEDADELNKDLPELIMGEALKLHELIGYQHFTKPPARFNDASLVKILEERGIGRPSTYAPTIHTLLYRDYVTRRGTALMPTELGEKVLDLLVEYFPSILDVQFTANMEEELDKIEEGDLEWVAVLKQFYKPFEESLTAARAQMQNLKQEPVPTEFKCDICGKQMLEKNGRFGKFLACSGFPDCRYTRSMPTGFRCPVEGCGGELVKRMSKMRRAFYGCSKYPTCTHIENKLPKKEGEPDEPEKAAEKQLERLGP